MAITNTTRRVLPDLQAAQAARIAELEAATGLTLR
jgi:hypothetical protein